MLRFALLFLAIWVADCRGSIIKDEYCSHASKGNTHFPGNFSFGVATAAYQTEGGWNADGKGPSIWDDFTHRFDKIDDSSNADISADSYNRFDEDLEILKHLKVNHYRFSISWSRIYPNGDISSRNQKGIDYYNNVIDKLLANGIEPMVTMFHFDLPNELQKLGGFANALVINQFVTYAIEMFALYGDRVKTWITLNEPLLFCKQSYGYSIYPPQINGPGIVDYICVDNALKAHAAAYRVYKSKFFKEQRGKVGIALDSQFSFSNDSDVFDRAMQFNFGFIAHPIFSKFGGYPEVLVDVIGNNSEKEGRITSRLPNLEGKWKEIVKGSADFLGLNYYTSRKVHRSKKPNGKVPSFHHDYDCDEISDPKWKRSISPWLFCVPEGLEQFLKYLRDEYDNVEVIITENGWSNGGDMKDLDRVQYIQSHLQAVLNAIQDGCNVSGYTYWSMIDNFEWIRGYTIKFGLYSVDLSSPKRERTPRLSAEYFRDVIQSRSITTNFTAL